MRRAVEETAAKSVAARVSATVESELFERKLSLHKDSELKAANRARIAAERKLEEVRTQRDNWRYQANKYRLAVIELKSKPKGVINDRT
jgi:hypothetical protein